MSATRLFAVSAQSVDGNSVTSPPGDSTGAKLLVAWISGSSDLSFATFSDSKGNTWTLIGPVGSFPQGRMYWCAPDPAKVGTGHTVTVSLGSSITPSIAFAAWSGMEASPYDQSNGAATSAGTISPGSITPSQDGCLVVIGVATSSDVGSIDSGFSPYLQSGATAGLAYGFAIGALVQSTAAPINPTITFGASEAHAAIIASFKVATATNTITAAAAGVVGTAQPVTLTLGSSPGTLVASAAGVPFGTVTNTGTIGLSPLLHGALVLSGVATFSGATSSIAGPTLTIASAQVTALTVASNGATLTGLMNIDPATTATADNSKITPTGTGTLFFSTVTTVISGSTITITPVGGKVLNGQTLTLAFATGALTVGADASTSFSIGGTGSTYEALITFTATATDEFNFNYHEAQGAADVGTTNIVRAGSVSGDLVTATLTYGGFEIAAGSEVVGGGGSTDTGGATIGVVYLGHGLPMMGDLRNRPRHVRMAKGEA